MALRRVAAALGLCVAGLGALVLAGWILRVEQVTNLGLGLASMKANTALGLLLTGIALRLHAGRPVAGVHAPVALAAAAALIGTATLLEDLLGVGLRIDELLVRDVPRPVATTSPGRMSPQSALGLLLSGTALCVLDRGRRGATAAQALGAASFVVAALSGAGLLYGVDPLESIAAPTRMAVHTMLGFAALSVGIVLARAERGPAAILTSETSAGTFARRLLPVALFLPVALGFVRLMGQRAGLYDTSLGLAVFAVTNAVILAGLVLWSARAAAASELERRESDARYRRIVETSAEGIWTVDAEDRTTFVNDRMAAMLGTTPARMLGRPLFDFVDAETRSALAPRLERRRQGIAERHELQLRREGGSEIWAGVSASPLRDAHGRYQGALAMVSDLTEQRRLEEVRKRLDDLEDANRRIAQVSRLKTEFLANMSHELRTPLNAIIGFAELLGDGVEGEVSDRQKELLGYVLDSGRHLLRLINDILDLAKIEAGKIDLRPQPTSLPVVVAEVAAILRETALRKRIAVATETDPALGEAFTDPARLKQILYNYLSNALKFTPEGGKVRVRLDAEGKESIRIEVEDSGPGVASKDLPRLFMEFEQLGPAAAGQQGTGLGLALTRRVAAALGGQVGVRSSVGQGSSFFAVLPLRMDLGRAQTDGPTPLLGPRAAGPTILAIEDDPIDAAFIIRVLTEAGWTVQTAGTAAEALARVAERDYDAVTLDLFLPDRDGLDLLRDLRALPRGGHLPVVVVTVASDRGLARAFPIQEVLRKPVAAGDLVAALERAGARSSGSRALLVDDDRPQLEMARQALSAIGLVPSCTSDAATALAEAERPGLAAIVLDLSMSPVDGFGLLDRLRASETGRVPVIVWTGRELTADEHERLRRRASAIVQKEGGAAALVEEVRRCLAAGARP